MTEHRWELERPKDGRRRIGVFCMRCNRGIFQDLSVRSATTFETFDDEHLMQTFIDMGLRQGIMLPDCDEMIAKVVTEE